MRHPPAADFSSCCRCMGTNEKPRMWVRRAVNIGKTMNALPPSPIPARKAPPKLPDHLSHIPIEICSESITFRCKPSLKQRIQRKADAYKVSMTKVLLWLADQHLQAPIHIEEDEA